MAGTSRIGVGVDATTAIRQMEHRAIVSAPGEFISPVDWNSVMLNTGLNVVQMGANVGVDIATKKAQRALEENLTPEETQKRISPALDTLSWLSLVTPQAGQAARNIQQTLDIRTIQEKQATDRMNEKLMLSEIADYAKNSTSVDEYKTMVDKAVNEIKSINSTGVSNDFISAASAYSATGSAIIDNHQKGLKYGNTAATFADKANRNFINQNPSPTEQELTDHFEVLNKNLAASVSKDGIVASSIYSILSTVGTPEVVQETLEKWGDYLTPEQRKNLTLLADTRSANPYRPSSDPLMALVKEKNAHGIGVPIDSNLFPPSEREAMELNKALTENVNLAQKTPAELRAYANDPSTPYNLSNAARSIARNIEISFNNDAVQAIKDFNVKTADKSLDLRPRDLFMPTLDKEKNLYGTADFIASLTQRIEEVGYVKNDWFKGANAIQNVLSKDEKDQLAQLSKLLSPEQKWGLANSVHDAFSGYNKKLTRDGATRFSEQYNIADMFNDNDLGGLVALQNNGEIADGANLYSNIKNAEIINPGGLSKLKSALGKTMVNKGLTKISPSLKSLILGRGLQTEWPTDSARFPVPDLDIMDLEALPKATWGSSLLTAKNGNKGLGQELDRYSKVLGLNLRKEMQDGKLRVVQLPNSIHQFGVEIAASDADAAAGSWTTLQDSDRRDVRLDINSATLDAPPPYWRRVLESIVSIQRS